MRLLCLILGLALMGACSSLKVRCDSRLRPINASQLSATRPQSNGAATVKP